MNAAANDDTTVSTVSHFGAAHIERLGVTVNIVTAYVVNNALAPADLPGLITQVHAALSGPASPAAAAPPETESAKPAAIRKSITPDALISFLDGKPYKTLKRHLTTHGLDPDSYRERFGLPGDYPMVAANYAAQRSAFAKSSGLGLSQRKVKARSADDETN